MKLLIAYATKYGTTERLAGRLQESLPVPTELANLKHTPDPAVDRYDIVLVGGSIYAGRIRPQVTKFCERYQDALMGRKVGVFITCLYGQEQGGTQVGENFPGWLLTHAFGSYILGGAVDYNRLRFLDRIIMQKIANVTSDIESINEEEIARLTADVQAITRGA